MLVSENKCGFWFHERKIKRLIILTHLCDAFKESLCIPSGSQLSYLSGILPSLQPTARAHTLHAFRDVNVSMHALAAAPGTEHTPFAVNRKLLSFCKLYAQYDLTLAQAGSNHLPQVSWLDLIREVQLEYSWLVSLFRLFLDFLPIFQIKNIYWNIDRVNSSKCVFNLKS